MSWYLDTNVIVALLTPELLSLRADGFLANNSDGLIVSDFAAAEFAAVIARRVRMRSFTPAAGRQALATFDTWVTRSAWRIEMNAVDVAAADALLRRLDLTLLTPDAIHIAIARRLGATIVTFDRV